LKSIDLGDVVFFFTLQKPEAESVKIETLGVAGWCQQREKIDWQEQPKFDCWLVQKIFIFFVVPHQFSQDIGK